MFVHQFDREEKPLLEQAVLRLECLERIYVENDDSSSADEIEGRLQSMVDNVIARRTRRAKRRCLRACLE